MRRRNLLKTLIVTTLVCASVAFAGDAAVKGNPNSKVYHKPVCRYYNAKGSTKEFKTEVEAQKAGYKACKQCCKSAEAKQTAEKKK